MAHRTLETLVVALASKGFHVPGGPTSRAPLGILAPKSSYFLGFLSKCTNSLIYCFALSQPATSFKTPGPIEKWALVKRQIQEFHVACFVFKERVNKVTTKLRNWSYRRSRISLCMKNHLG
jgi:hypothetical protein